MNFRTIIEPFRIKSVESVKFTRREDREAALKEAGYNLFRLRAEDVLIDLLTDSGTGAMSAAQWGALMQGDESVRRQPVVLPVRGGRARPDRLHARHPDAPGPGGRAHPLPQRVLKAGQVVPNNNHFDTTRANIEVEACEARDLVIAEGRVPALVHPFKGNVDLDALERTLREEGERVPLVMVTVTNNSGGGQPVSLENLRGVRALCDRYRKPFFLDACRFAENAYFIKLREAGQQDRTPKAIAQEMFSLADGCTMSAKKDGLANIGGFLALNDDRWAETARNLLILTEGFPTYGGLAGYDLEAIARGLEEVVEEPYLRYRIRSTEYLGDKLTAAGVPIDPAVRRPRHLPRRAGAAAAHPPLQYPGIALANALYVEAGIRGVEIGTVMFGLHPDGSETPGPMDLVRLAIPRRVYTQSHIDYVAEGVIEVARLKQGLRGYRMTSAPARAEALHGAVRAAGRRLTPAVRGLAPWPVDHRSRADARWPAYRRGTRDGLDPVHTQPPRPLHRQGLPVRVLLRPLRQRLHVGVQGLGGRATPRASCVPPATCSAASSDRPAPAPTRSSAPIQGPAHDKAFRDCVEETKPHFRQCPKCAKWVCLATCWNQARSLCYDCAPDVETEIAAAQAQSTAQQIREKVAQQDLTRHLDLTSDASALCPGLRRADRGREVLPGVRQAAAPEERVPAVRHEDGGKAKFCPECGQKAG